ncbi:GntR family transcriptional regulator [Pseudovibrio flavus]|uniref:GntR family transcriptional regulator n=1 Tax=Pseudovibrio flavus TaxID=2529854 RepID=UPI0035288C35
MSTEEGGEQSRSQAAYQKLFEAIQTGEIGPGARIREVEIAERFGISRTPVRDAIRRLEGEGLIVHEPRLGAVVKQMSKREVIELYEMRAVLEGTAARMAAQHASEPEISELEELNALMLEADGDERKAAAANRQFHTYLYHAAKNPFLLKSVMALSNALAVLGGTTLEGSPRIKEAYEEHKAILEGIRQRDPDKADAAARKHIEYAQRMRMRLMREAQEI